MADRFHDARKDYCTCPRCTKARQENAASRDVPATDDQITYLEQTLLQHELFTGHFDRLWSALEAHRIDEREPGDGTRIGRHHADQIIGWVNRQIGIENLRPLPDRRPRSSTGLPLRASGVPDLGALRQPGCRHSADRHGNCRTCGVEMFDPSLR